MILLKLKYQTYYKTSMAQESSFHANKAFSGLSGGLKPWQNDTRSGRVLRASPSGTYQRLGILNIEGLWNVKISVCLMDKSLAVICIARRDEVTRVPSRVQLREFVTIPSIC